MTGHEHYQKVSTYISLTGSLSKGVDLWVVEDVGIPPAVWATYRDVSPRAVRQSVRRAAEDVGIEVDL